MKKRLILILTIVVLCAALVGATIAMVLSTVTPQTDDTSSPTEDAPVVSEQIPTEDLAAITSLPNTIFYMETLHADADNWPYNCTSEMIDDYVLLTVTGTDPGYTITTGAPFEAGNYLAILYSTTTARNCSTQFYTGPGTSPSEANMVTAPLTLDGEWHQAIVDVSSIFSSTKTAMHLRFDPLHADAGKRIPSNAKLAVKYIAFFDTEEEAKAFDYDAYLRYLNGEPLEEANWPAPTYQDKTGVTSADTYAGTLQYTPSADGSNMTISYTTGSKKHSYTVPNENNYLFGGYAGTDDLDRTLHNSGQVGVVGDNGNKQVGIFYFLWHGDSSVQNGSNKLYDLQKIIDTYGTTTASKVNSTQFNGEPLYGDVGHVHWFAEPLYGYYHNDPWVMRKHAELLTNAGVDFIYFDVTNGFAYTTQAIKMMNILHDLNEQGFDAPQVVFYTNSASSTVVTTLYNEIYSKNVHPDTWYRINGKPVIVCTERSDNLRTSGTIDSTIKSFFTMKESQWPLESKQTNGWPWMDFEWPQKVYTNASGGERTMNVSIAQHNDYSNNYTFSSSALHGNYKNRGRSYGSTAAQIASWSTSLGKTYYNAYKADPSMTDHGYNFQAQWDHAINSNIQYALVTGWNEWIAQRQNGETFHGDANKVAFVDAASMEFSRDAEMMRGGYFDNYYMQLIYNIERFKGDAPVIMQDSRKPINVTGEFDQWDSVLVSYTDPAGDNAMRKGQGYGDVTYTNDTGRNDIVSAKITHDTKNVYFYAQTRSTVSMYDTNSSWMQLFLDTDRNANTGWYGYDYIVNYKASGYFTTTVAKYTGTNGAYGYTNVGTVSYRASGNQMMIQVPMSLLGISSYSNINMEFKWADSDTTYTTMEQFYTDGDAAPLGRLNYVYQTFIPGEASHTCTYGAWTTTAATCTTAGSQTRTCTGCGASETQTIPATGHTEVTVSGSAATCTTPGKTEGKSCSVCGAVIQTQTAIPATGHTEVTVPAVPATCTQSGLTAGSTCSVCGETLIAQGTIPAPGHTEITISATPATCTTAGKSEGKKCAVCDTVTLAQATIPATGHTDANGDLKCDSCGNSVDCPHSSLNPAVKENEVAATCTTAGSYDMVVYCSACHSEMSRDTSTVPAKGHTEVTVSGYAATCTAAGKTDGKKCSVCQTVTVAQDTIPAKGHTEVTVSGYAATCTTAGKTDGKKCSVCQTVTVAQTSIPAKGHTDNNNDQVCDTCGTVLSTVCQHTYVTTTTPATCTTAGQTVETCSRCGDKKITTIPAKGHTEVTVSGYAATCSTTGKTDGKKCSVCQTVTVAQQTIPTTAHTEVTVSGTPATCTETGLSDGKMCSVCQTVTVAQEIIPTTAHTEVTVPGKGATCTEAGLTSGKKCSACDTVIVAQETIPAIGHSETVLPATDATCITDGKTEGIRCLTCGETLVAQTTIPAPGHIAMTVSGTSATCTTAGTTDGSKCIICDDILIAQTTIPAKGHTEETVNGTEPTCTEAGLSDGKKCAVCDEILAAQTTIPAVGHTETTLEAVDPSCTMTGLTSGKQCTVCGTVIEEQTVIAATGHTAGEWIVDIEPTVESAGQRTRKCTVCETVVAIEPIAALPVPETDPAETEPESEPDTDAPATESTAAPDSGETTEPDGSVAADDTTSAADSTDASSEGCGSTVSISAFLVIAAILALAGTCLRRRKQHGNA